MSEESLESMPVGVSTEQNDCKRYFADGSIFCAPVEGDGWKLVCVEEGTSLTITTATYSDGKAGVATLQCMLNEDMEMLALCHVPKGTTVTGLGLTLIGPQDIILAAPDASINVFGTVSSTTSRYIAPPPMENADEKVVDQMLLPADNKQDSDAQRQNGMDPEVVSKKRKMSDSEDCTAQTEPSIEQETSEENPDASNVEEPSRLSKKQRRKLAKKKEKELTEAVAFLNKHEFKQETTGVKDVSKKVVPLTKERRLKGGIVVKDIIIGVGATVKPGRKVSILYEGAFQSGKVFDRNKNRNNPLSFRQGTGEVIRGLERGLDGMRVGGEREITIPPELGYGKKGSGKVVPPNSTLVFSVQLIGVGG